MGDSIDENEALQKTYMPVDLATVRSAMPAGVKAASW